jgi:hypothetical protein
MGKALLKHEEKSSRTGINKPRRASSINVFSEARSEVQT